MREKHTKLRVREKRYFIERMCEKGFKAKKYESIRKTKNLYLFLYILKKLRLHYNVKAIFNQIGLVESTKKQKISVIHVFDLTRPALDRFHDSSKVNAFSFIYVNLLKVNALALFRLFCLRLMLLALFMLI
jgi:hypothetical protein